MSNSTIDIDSLPNELNIDSLPDNFSNDKQTQPNNSSETRSKVPDFTSAKTIDIDSLPNELNIDSLPDNFYVNSSPTKTNNSYNIEKINTQKELDRMDLWFNTLQKTPYKAFSNFGRLVGDTIGDDEVKNYWDREHKKVSKDIDDNLNKLHITNSLQREVLGNAFGITAGFLTPFKGGLLSGIGNGLVGGGAYGLMVEPNLKEVAKDAVISGGAVGTLTMLAYPLKQLKKIMGDGDFIQLSKFKSYKDLPPAFREKIDYVAKTGTYEPEELFNNVKKYVGSIERDENIVEHLNPAHYKVFDNKATDTPISHALFSKALAETGGTNAQNKLLQANKLNPKVAGNYAREAKARYETLMKTAPKELQEIIEVNTKHYDNNIPAVNWRDVYNEAKGLDLPKEYVDRLEAYSHLNDHYIAPVLQGNLSSDVPEFIKNALVSSSVTGTLTRGVMLNVISRIKQLYSIDERLIRDIAHIAEKEPLKPTKLAQILEEKANIPPEATAKVMEEVLSPNDHSISPNDHSISPNDHSISPNDLRTKAEQVKKETYDPNKAKQVRKGINRIGSWDTHGWKDVLNDDTYISGNDVYTFIRSQLLDNPEFGYKTKATLLGLKARPNKAESVNKQAEEFAKAILDKADGNVDEVARMLGIVMDTNPEDFYKFIIERDYPKKHYWGLLPLTAPVYTPFNTKDNNGKQ